MGLVKAGIRLFQYMWLSLYTNIAHTYTMLHSMYHRSFPKRTFVEGDKNLQDQNLIFRIWT